MLKYVVAFSSKTGNTRAIAGRIFDALPAAAEEKEIVDIGESGFLMDAETYFIGFPVHRMTCGMDIIDSLSELHGVSIAFLQRAALNLRRRIKKKSNRMSGPGWKMTTIISAFSYARARCRMK